MCLVENIMAIDTEAVPVESDPSVLILPAFDYNLKERSDSRCSVCTTFQSSRKPHSEL